MNKSRQIQVALRKWRSGESEHDIAAYLGVPIEQVRQWVASHTQRCSRRVLLPGDRKASPHTPMQYRSLTLAESLTPVNVADRRSLNSIYTHATPRLQLRETVQRRSGEPVLPTITFHAVVYDTLSSLLPASFAHDAPGPFYERFLNGAFLDYLKDSPDVLACVGHDPNAIIGRTTAGTLRLRENSKGVVGEVDPPNTSAGRDLVESVRRGDIRGMSFGFREDSARWTAGPGGERIREVVSAKLYECSFTPIPAYPQTSAQLKRQGGSAGPALLPREVEAMARLAASRHASDKAMRKLKEKYEQYEVQQSLDMKSKELDLMELENM